MRLARVNDALAKSRLGTDVQRWDCARPEMTHMGKRLALGRPPWQGLGTMTNGKKNPTGGGAIIALLILAGAIGGGLLGQPSAGLLAGAALGGLIALLLWLRERGR